MGATSRTDVLLERRDDQSFMKLLRSLLWAVTGGGLLLLVCLRATPAQAELTLPTLRTRQVTYTNVVVTGKTESDIYIRHERGIGNVKLDDIEDDEALVALGLKAPPVKVEVVTNTVDGVVTLTTNEPPPAAETATARYQQQIREKWEQLQRYRPTLELTSGLLALGVLLVFHLFFSFCLKLICVKAGYQPGFAVWLPVLQVIPALRAAGMSLLWLLPTALWLVGMFSLPLLSKFNSPALAGVVLSVVLVWLVVTLVLNWLAQIIWCFKITSARGKSILVAVMLLLPVLNVFAFLYLAFSSRAEE